MKDDIRKKYKKMRDQMSKDEIFERSKLIFDKIISLDEYKKSNNIFAFVSFGNEIHTHEFIDRASKEGKNIYIPLVDKPTNSLKIVRFTSFEDLRPGVMGILEPTQDSEIISDPNDIDLILTPGIAFDHRGNRIGYGAGYYDRLFNTMKRQDNRIGIAFDYQLIDSIPCEAHDEKITKLVTEKDVYNFNYHIGRNEHE